MSNFSWVECNSGTVPPNALKAGTDSDGSRLYVGRAIYQGEVVLGKVAPNHECAFVPWGGSEISRKNYEVLCGGPGAWMLASDGEIHKDAVQGGKTAKCENLYVGRVFYQGSLTPGKIQPSKKVCYISYGGQEFPFSEYEVLVSK